MITMWTLYVLNVLFNLSSFVGVLAPISVFTCIGMVFFILISELDKEVVDFVKKYIKYPIIVIIFCSLVHVAIPSKKEALAIYIIPKVLNNQQVQELPDNALKYLNVFFKKEIAEITNGLEEK